MEGPPYYNLTIYYCINNYIKEYIIVEYNITLYIILQYIREPLWLSTHCILYCKGALYRSSLKELLYRALLESSFRESSMALAEPRAHQSPEAQGAGESRDKPKQKTKTKQKGFPELFLLFCFGPKNKK